MSLKQRLKHRVMLTSRAAKLDEFYALTHEGQTILDVGVAGEKGKKPSPTRNYLLNHYRYAPETYTGLSIQDLDGMAELYPGKRFVRYDGATFPFADDSFDWVFSNAVIEHVGDHEAQLRFLNEMLRVGRNVYFTTPNRYFPVESHTQVFFLHWSDPLFFRYCRRFKTWVTPENLRLLSRADVETLMARSNATEWEIRENGPVVPMTFNVVAR